MVNRDRNFNNLVLVLDFAESKVISVRDRTMDVDLLYEMTFVEDKAGAIGDKPGVGRYCCTSCGWSAVLDDASDVLPPCATCGAGQQTRYRRC